MIKEEQFMNKKFGRLKAVGPVESVHKPNGYRFRAVWCECDCGGKRLVQVSSLINGSISSCGCLAKENHQRLGNGRKDGTIKSSGNTKHSGNGTRIYSIWSNMNNRCTYPSCDNYKYYGGRGIKVCKEWCRDNKYGFENFRAFAYTMGYNDTKELDRIDTDGDYCPENCRFVSHKFNTNNQSNNVNITYGDQTFTAAQWGRLLGIDDARIRKRISEGWSEIDAITIPVLPEGTVSNYKKKKGVKPVIFLNKSELNKILAEEQYANNVVQNYYNNYENKYEPRR